jgi:hypothetical protein
MCTADFSWPDCAIVHPRVVERKCRKGQVYFKSANTGGIILRSRFTGNELVALFQVE